MYLMMYGNIRLLFNSAVYALNSQSCPRQVCGQQRGFIIIGISATELPRNHNNFTAYVLQRLLRTSRVWAEFSWFRSLLCLFLLLFLHFSCAINLLSFF